MTCRDIDECKNCPIKQLCDKVDDYCDDGRIDHELLAKIYTKGREDAFTQILMYLNDAAFAQSEEEEECAICIRQLMQIIEDMEGKDIKVPTTEEGE